MKVKHLFRHGLVMAAVAIIGTFSFVACSDEVDNPINQGEQTEEGGEGFVPDILFESTAYVASDLDADLKTALGYGIREISDVANAQQKVLIVNKLTDLDEALLKKAYELGHTVAVAFPVKAEIEAFVETHDWLELPTDNISDNLLLFSFNGEDRYAAIEKPISEGDPIVNNINRARDFYVFLSNWMTGLNKLYVEVQAPVPNNESGLTNMEDFAGLYQFSNTINYSTNIKYRENLWSDPDYMSGSGSITVAYSVFTAHVYNDQTSPGDYYGVKMRASIANAGMWNDKGANKHGGLKTYWCGFWCNYFEVEARLCEKNNFDKVVETVAFPQSAAPSPKTAIGQTSYENSQSFTLSASKSIGGKSTSKGKDAPANETSGQVSATAGWTWSHKESRTVSDVDIMNETYGNVAKWKVKFNNLPKYNYTYERYGFDLGDAVAYRSTFDLEGSWIWYDSSDMNKNAKDNKTKMSFQHYYLITKVNAEYQMQNFVTLIDDLWSKYYKPEGCISFDMPIPVNVTSGTLVLKNDLKDGAAIWNVEVKDAESGNVYSTFPNTIPNSAGQTLGSFATKNKYIVTFSAKVPGGETKTYAYTLNPQIEIPKGDTVTLYALNDFTAQ